ncbi:MAG: hypothetical protein LH473_08740, partial [Chitinophagales bacterium]|nr:hypothetical protein [Chitinophagales bacterium]
DGTTLSTAAGGGGGIGGSGTTSYIPKFTSSSAIGNSSIYDNAGLIGIGTTVPASKLHALATDLTTITAENTSTSGTSPITGVKSLLTSAATNSKTAYFGNITSSTSNIGVIRGLDLDISQSGIGQTYGLDIDITGSGGSSKYGISSSLNTSSTSDIKYGCYISVTDAKLHTQPSYGLRADVFGDGTGAKYGVYANMGTGGTGIRYGVYSNATGSTNYAGYFLGRGYFSDNVGIGTNAPGYRLHIDGGSDASLGSGGYVVTGSTTGTNVAIDNNEIMARNNGAASKLYLNNDGGDVSMCYSGGGVMIGSSYVPTGYLFAVDGNIICEELKVQLSSDWPDYVFEKDYSLHSISELKTFIEKNKHLPGIPTATEVKENGISAGDMQSKMMEKIEELSLYIIQLQHQIDELKVVNN